MKSAVKPFRPELEELTRAARETLAQDAFNDVKVKGLLSAAAKDGRCVCVVPAPLDLSATEAAKRLLAWCDREGLSTSWRKGLPPEQDAEAPNNLVVKWEKPKALEQAAKAR